MNFEDESFRAVARRRTPYIFAVILLFVFLAAMFVFVDDGRSGFSQDVEEVIGDPDRRWDFPTFYLLITLPLGAAIVVFMRMIIGLRTFGLFTPMLLSMSYLQAGPIVGPLISTGAILIGMLAAPLLRGLQLSRVAFLGVTIAIVVTTLSAVAQWSSDRIFISALPVVVTALVVERWWVTWEAEGLRKALTVTFATLAVAVLIELIISLPVLEMTASRAPALIPALSGVAMILLGKYKGLRLIELLRFRTIWRRED